jgi:insulysin
MNAVDSEYNMSLQSDAWRHFMLLQTIAHKDSTLHRFNCGNKETLGRPGVREDLLAFHKKWYSSNIMNLAISGNHSIEEMEAWVREKFGPVKNLNVTLPDLSKPRVPYDTENLG